MTRPVPTRIAGFAAALLALFGLAVLAGTAPDPQGGDATAEEQMAAHADGGPAGDGSGAGGHGGGATETAAAEAAPSGGRRGGHSHGEGTGDGGH